MTNFNIYANIFVCVFLCVQLTTLTQVHKVGTGDWILCRYRHIISPVDLILGGFSFLKSLYLISRSGNSLLWTHLFLPPFLDLWEWPCLFSPTLLMGTLQDSLGLILSLPLTTPSFITISLDCTAWAAFCFPLTSLSLSWQTQGSRLLYIILLTLSFSRSSQVSEEATTNKTNQQLTKLTSN